MFQQNKLRAVDVYLAQVVGQEENLQSIADAFHNVSIAGVSKMDRRLERQLAEDINGKQKSISTIQIGMEKV